MSGMAADDLIYAGEGTDTIDGGDGVDTVYYHYTPTGQRVVVDLYDAVGYNFAKKYNVATGALVSTDSVVNVENAYGGANNDYLYGSAGDNTLWGNAGNDTLYGRNGRILHGAGDDTYYYNLGGPC
jgi:Ca2+-binding RTX toxin-like protein